MSSFDPDNFGAPTGRNGYDDSGYSRSSESRFRTIPLVLSILFGIAAAVCTVISYVISGSNLTADQEALRSTAMLVGMASFIGLIIVGRKVLRKR